jgi:hypothetical protein
MYVCTGPQSMKILAVSTSSALIASYTKYIST